MDTLQQAPLTLCLTKAGLSAGTTSTVTTTATVTYANRGKLYSKAALTNQATPTTDAVTGLAFPALNPNQGVEVILGFDVSGNLKAMQGSIAPLDGQGNFIGARIVPTVPDGVVPFGYIILKAGTTLSGTFTFGTSNLSGVTGMTYSFQDIATLPDRPQIS